MNGITCNINRRWEWKKDLSDITRYSILGKEKINSQNVPAKNKQSKQEGGRAGHHRVKQAT